MDDGRIHADVGLVVLGRRAEDAWILWQIALCEGRHNAPGAWAGDAQAHLIAEGEYVAGPGVLDEILHAVTCLQHDVRPEPSDLEPPKRIQLAESLEPGGRQRMHNRTVARCSL